MKGRGKRNAHINASETCEQVQVQPHISGRLY